jgi:hypothetical protein
MEGGGLGASPILSLFLVFMEKCRLFEVLFFWVFSSHALTSFWVLVGFFGLVGAGAWRASKAAFIFGWTPFLL